MASTVVLQLDFVKIVVFVVVVVVVVIVVVVASAAILVIGAIMHFLVLTELPSH